MPVRQSYPVIASCLPHDLPGLLVPRYFASRGTHDDRDKVSNRSAPKDLDLTEDILKRYARWIVGHGPRSRYHCTRKKLVG
jgi:hypothetical protein